MGETGNQHQLNLMFMTKVLFATWFPFNSSLAYRYVVTKKLNPVCGLDSVFGWTKTTPQYLKQDINFITCSIDL